MGFLDTRAEQGLSTRIAITWEWCILEENVISMTPQNMVKIMGVTEIKFCSKMDHFWYILRKSKFQNFEFSKWFLRGKTKKWFFRNRLKIFLFWCTFSQKNKMGKKSLLSPAIFHICEFQTHKKVIQTNSANL